MKIAYCGGFWATNIGNAFYDIGIMHVLKKVFGDESVRFVNDVPGWFWQEGGGNPSKSFDYNSLVEGFDYYVLSGPVFHKDLLKIYKTVIPNLKKKKIKIGFVSCGLSKYTPEEISMSRNLLKEIEPAFIITRDKETHDALGDLAPLSESGICCAFYLNECSLSYPLSNKRYIVYNFDIFGEPTLKISEDAIERRVFDSDSVIVTGKTYLNYPRTNGHYDVVRTIHNCFKKNSRTLFYKNNSYYSDLPENYINIYANSNLTLSNRVHACVATLAFGNAAQYMVLDHRSNTKRTNLFKAVGAGEVSKKPVFANMDLIAQKKLDIESALARL